MKQPFMLAVASLVVCSFQLALAQGPPPGGPGGPGGFGRGGGFFGGGDNTLMLLRDENVRKELEIVESQEEKLRTLGDKVREEMGSLFSGLRDLQPEEREARFREIQEQMKTKQADLKKQLDEILLPNQRDRLKQISFQARSRYQSTSEVLSSGDAAEALKLTDEQKTKLAEKQRELDEKLRKEIEALRNKYRDELLDVLTPEQKAKWKELMGNPIEFGQPQFGRRGGPGGTPGERPNSSDN